jgi:hypothetical protein
MGILGEEMTHITPLSEPIKLFNGYIETAGVNVGYGANGSTCQVTLVFDNDGPIRSVSGQTGRDGSGASLPRLSTNFPELGTAVGFKAGEMTFGGILQRYVEQKLITGYKWDLVIEAPGKILDGVQVVLDSFQGTAYNGKYPSDPSTYEPVMTGYTDEQLNNIWNPFAELENYTYFLLLLCYLY